MAKAGDYKIPFDKDGNQLSYPDFYYMNKGGSEVQNFEFEDTLVYKGYGRGRSSAFFTFERASNNKTVSFFMSDMDDIINKMQFGRLPGRFTFVKKGQNFGCRMIS